MCPVLGSGHASQTRHRNSTVVRRGAVANVPDEIQPRLPKTRVGDQQESAGQFARHIIRRLHRIRQQRE